MTRIIPYTLLLLAISCGNAVPENTSETEKQPVAQTAVEETPAPQPEAEIPAPQKASASAAIPAAPKPSAAKPAPAKKQVASPVPTPAPVKAAAEQPAPTAAAPVEPAETEAVPAATTETAAETAVPMETIVPAEPATEIAVSRPAPTTGQNAAAARPGNEPMPPVMVSTDDLPLNRSKRFLPTRRRIDREINKLKFAYKGEVMMGLTASYGTMSSDDSDIMLIIDGIDAEGTVATVKPFLGYFYRDNNCLGVRFGYRHMGGRLDSGRYDFGESNDTSGDIPKLDFNSDNYSFGIFHRSYAGLDPKGRFGLFAEFELSLATGSSKFSYQPNSSSEEMKTTYSDNTQVKLSFNPGAAVYIFPNVCATISFGLGGIQYTSVTQKDGEGKKIGTREASNMRFRLNIAAINFGMTIHLWDKKKK